MKIFDFLYQNLTLTIELRSKCIYRNIHFMGQYYHVSDGNLKPHRKKIDIKSLYHFICTDIVGDCSSNQEVVLLENRQVHKSR